MRGAVCDFINKATPYTACCEAGDGVAAIKKAKERAPALVVMDLSMPGMNGVDAASVLRGIVPSAKIVGFTTFDEEFRKDLLTLDTFDMVLSKRDGFAKLADAINGLLPAESGHPSRKPTE